MDSKLVRPSSLANSILAEATLFHQAGKLTEAEKAYRTVLSEHPNDPNALHLLGVLLAQKNNIEAGIGLIEQAILIQPNFSEAYFNLGRIFHSSNKLQQAVLAYTTAAHMQKGYIKAWNNLGAVYSDMGKYEEALSALENGITINAKVASLYDNTCRVHKRQGNYVNCVAIADLGLAQLPNDPTLWIHRSEACFMLGRFEEAWENYRWRTHHPDNVNSPQDYPYPLWQGESLSTKTILIWTEQGPGETFVFSTMLPDIISAAKRCVLLTTERLRPIMARSFPDIEVCTLEIASALPPDIDVQSSLVDLGRWLRPSWDSFPMQGSHIVADPERVKTLRSHYEQVAQGKPIVGIAWRSKNVATAALKSTFLDSWRPILTAPSVTFVNLQYGDVNNEIDQLRAATGLKIITEPTVDPIVDLDGHLAQVAAMDLVISTSNTTVHAAGAQNVPVWCLVPKVLGEGLRWIWFTDRENSPWYESVRIYRQVRQGDWTDPIGGAAIDLVGWSAAQSSNFNTANQLEALALAFRKAGQSNPMGVAANAALTAGAITIAAYRMAAKSERNNGHAESSIRILEKALKDHDKNVELLIDHASSLVEVGRLDDAIASLKNALKLAPESPQALNNLGKALRLRGRLDEALGMMKKARDQAPHLASIRLSIATFLLELGRIEEAIDAFDVLIKNDPANVSAASSRAIALLAGGNLKDGWPAYRERLARGSANVRYDSFPHPVWQGELLDGAHVLVWTEQGIGEEILVATLIPELIIRAAAVTLLCSSRMVPVFQRSFPGVVVAERKEPLGAAALDPEINFQMSLSDLGAVMRPSLECFPTDKKEPDLKADSRLTKDLRKKYAAQANGQPIIGLTWQSKTPDIGNLKSLDPVLAAELIAGSKAMFVCLQYDPDDAHLQLLSEAGQKRWIYDRTVDPLEDMDRAAAQIAAMDFVITVSNTTAHTAGALGIPTALLVPPTTGRHWYWFRNLKRSVWYPSVRLYETQHENQWQDVIPDLAADLEGVLGLP